MDVNEIFSIVVSIFSIFLGICAIVQAKRYNQESDKLNADTKKMLSLQLEEIQTIEKKIARYLVKTDENKICLAKDGGYIFKLRIYDKRNKSAILNAFQNLKVKAPVLKRFEIFLEEDQEQFFFDFFYMAETRNELKIRGVKEELEKYGLVFIVDYQARKNNFNNSGSR